MVREIEREEILEDTEFLQFDSAFNETKQSLLAKFLEEFDYEVVGALLKAGADANINPGRQYGEENDGFLHDLIHDYKSQRVVKGESIIKCIELLLENGANPDQSGDCNTAPIQYCDSEATQSIKELLLKYNAKPEGNIRY